MTPKEKAKDLVDTFYYSLPNNGSTEGLNSTTRRYAEAKQCASIAVDEILSINNERWYQLSGFKETFYKEVKQEIEKL